MRAEKLLRNKKDELERRELMVSTRLIAQLINILELVNRLCKRLIAFQATYIGYEVLIQARAARSPKFAAKLKKMRGE